VFHVRSLLVQIGLFLLCPVSVPDVQQHPHDLVIPFLGRNGFSTRR